MGIDWEMVKKGLETIEEGMTQIDDGIPYDWKDDEFTNLNWQLMQLWGQMMNITYREGKFTNPDSYP